MWNNVSSNNVHKYILELYICDIKKGIVLVLQLRTIGIGQINFIEEKSGFYCLMEFPRGLTINLRELNSDINIY